MKKIIISCIVMFCCYASFAGQDNNPISPLLSSGPAKKNNSLFRAGFKIGFNIPFSKDIDINLKANSILSTEFGAFFKVGKWVFAEIGFGYTFQKNKFHLSQDSTMLESFDDVAEFRYLQIPLRVTGEISLGEIVNLMPHVGVIYQPLIQVTKNHLQLSKDNITRHAFLFSAGIGIQIYFVTLDIAYRYSLTKYIRNSSLKKPSFLNVSIGFQF